jgi:hypothetical protein
LADDRRDVDQAPVVCRTDVVEKDVGAVEHAAEVGVDDLLPVG